MVEMVIGNLNRNINKELEVTMPGVKRSRFKLCVHNYGFESHTVGRYCMVYCSHAGYTGVQVSRPVTACTLLTVCSIQELTGLLFDRRGLGTWYSISSTAHHQQQLAYTFLDTIVFTACLLCC